METKLKSEDLFRLELELANYIKENSTLKLNEIIAEEFIEFGASGKVYNREQVIKELENCQKKRDIKISGFKASEISESVWHVTYNAILKSDNGSDIITLRSSLWKNSGKGLQIVFHQGTKKQ